MQPEFDSRDPADPTFWNERFDRHFMPWDKGGVPEALRRFAGQAGKPYVTLIPGCGLGYEVGYLSEAGWQVAAIDFSPSAVTAARAILGPWAERVHEADFFSYAPPFQLELIYERAFLCALPRRMWPQVARRWAELLPIGGLLAGFFFFSDGRKGPPFGISAEELDALLNPYFERIEECTVADSIEVFKGKERWQVWRRLAD